ncbi:hypothetical protein HYH03_013659 [Edaphochlamys debaryana]|uniref:Rab-GAP TBC domain-containing protein n=1 Tax=Edaphochlamys debaryana TaxID=47281 RepID=A0A835XQK6_9CHLO|nr:hypothetical protein HYH03_013659 [Edaphochlamys debaryana]|eukprot:KAG2487815.1 hypothetical protein HYH03_013659 [Edaphochlamys debaryana]
MQEKVWAEFAQKHKLPTSASKVKRLVRSGIPPRCRAWVWPIISGSVELKAEKGGPNYYPNLLKASSMSKFAEQVELDLPRSFPGHPYLAAPEGQAAMRRILLAFSIHNPVVGYCQGLNYIAGLVLLAVNKDQEATFWILVALVERICFAGTFNQNLSGCHVEMRTLQLLVDEKLPRLGAHMRKLQCDTSLLATDWFLTLYTGCMPAESACRVLDAVLSEGAKVIFRVAVALMKSAEAALLQVNNAGDFMRVVKDWVANLYDIDGLMAVAFDGIGPLPMERLEAIRAEKAAEVREFMERRKLQQQQRQRQQQEKT